MTEIDLNEASARQIATDLGAMPKQFELAMQRAVMRTGPAVRAAITMAVAKNSDLPADLVKSLRTRVPREDRGAKIWVGFDPLSLSKLSPEQTKPGVATQGIGRFVRGAFLINKIGKKRHPVWARADSSLPTKITEGWVMGNLRGSPTKLFLDIRSAQVVAEAKFRELAPAIFMKHFQREINKIMNYA